MIEGKNKESHRRTSVSRGRGEIGRKKVEV